MLGSVKLQILHILFHFPESLWDCYILLFHWHYNLEDGTCIHPMSEDLIFSKEDARCLTSEADGHDHLWKMMQRVQKLDLTLEEKVVSAALCLMNAGVNIDILSLCKELSSTGEGQNTTVLCRWEMPLKRSINTSLLFNYKNRLISKLR